MNSRYRKLAPAGAAELAQVLSESLIGQPEAVEAIVPYVQIFQAHLAPEGRPAGVFLLLGPTGTGKTRTVECLAQALHGNERHFLRVDCGEFQMDHEVAKLIGAPPGYLGHRETQPMLNQAKLNSFTSERCGMSIVLFDEVEKAAPSLNRLLLGVLDKATLRLGDNTGVNFERSMLFLTSNLGAREMMNQLAPNFGFEAIHARSSPPASTLAPTTFEEDEALSRRLETIGVNAVKKKFSPEFYNRIDRVVTYRPLDEASLDLILDQQLDTLQQLLNSRLGLKSFYIRVDVSARAHLLLKGASRLYGARELKRTIHRLLLQPLASLVASGRIPPGVTIRARHNGSSEVLELSASASDKRTGSPTPRDDRTRATRARRPSYLGLELDPEDLDAA
ncbi:MAG: ATP-dependent Clp protease ATP-binding subunit [Bryobacterales bacterium]|nr:ATP-dependent Clp protease ATP-binding subunit [Bryobacterales bacterium]